MSNCCCIPRLTVTSVTITTTIVTLVVDRSLSTFSGCFTLCMTASMLSATAGTARIQLSDGTTVVDVYQPNSMYLRADSLIKFLRRRTNCKCCSSVTIRGFRSSDPDTNAAFCEKFCPSAFIPAATASV